MIIIATIKGSDWGIDNVFCSLLLNYDDKDQYASCNILELVNQISDDLVSNDFADLPCLLRLDKSYNIVDYIGFKE